MKRFLHFTSTQTPFEMHWNYKTIRLISIVMIPFKPVYEEDKEKGIVS
jgi:hypothetical protein